MFAISILFSNIIYNSRCQIRSCFVFTSSFSSFTAWIWMSVGLGESTRCVSMVNKIVRKVNFYVGLLRIHIWKPSDKHNTFCTSLILPSPRSIREKVGRIGKLKTANSWRLKIVWNGSSTGRLRSESVKKCVASHFWDQVSWTAGTWNCELKIA